MCDKKYWADRLPDGEAVLFIRTTFLNLKREVVNSSPREGAGSGFGITCVAKFRYLALKLQ